MLNETQIFGLLGALLMVAFFANRLSTRTRVPDLLVLMVAGLVAGPLTGWLHASEFAAFTRYLGTFALILILFEAGSEIRLREALRHFPAGVLFAFISFGASFGMTALVARWLLGLPPHQCLLFGGVFGCVSGTIVIPVLQQFEIGGAVSVVLLLEAALGDVIAVITVGSLTNIAEGDPLLGGLLRGVATRTVVAILAAVISGLLWSRARSRLAAYRFGSITQLGAVLLVYAGTKIMGGSGLLAVLAFGLTLANVRGAAGTRRHEGDLLTFHSDLSFLVRSFFFVLLGASVELIGRDYVLATVAILGGLGGARIASVYGLKWALRSLGNAERQLAISLFPRGLVNAVLAIEVAAHGVGMNFLPAMTFTVILVTNLLVVVATWRFQASAPIKTPEAMSGSESAPLRSG